MRRFFHVLTLAVAYMLIWAPAAHAGPALAPLLGSIFKRIIISMIISFVSNKLFGPKKPKPGEMGASAIMLNKQSNNDPIPVVYGRRRLGGVRAYIETSDNAGDESKTQYLNMVILLCEGEMGAIKRVWFNDEITWDADDTGTATLIASGGYELDNLKGKYAAARSDVAINYYPGTTTQTVDTMIQTSVGTDKWDSNHRLRGLAYLVVRLKANGEKYQGAAPTITCELEGKVIQNVATLAWEDGSDQNPADVLYDYLRNDIYGKGLLASDIDLASFQSARTYAATRYAINGVIDTGQEIYQNIQTICSSFNADLIYTAGVYKLQIRQDNLTSSHSFTRDNILGSVEVNVTDVRNRLNKITINYANRDDEIAFNDDIVIVDNATYYAEDSNRRLETQVTENLITDRTLIETLANYRLDISRYQTGISFKAPHTAFTVEAGDVIDVTLPGLGWSGKLFRVAQITIDNDNTIDIIAQEYVPAVEI